jgi:hypothetical protein
MGIDQTHDLEGNTLAELNVFSKLSWLRSHFGQTATYPSMKPLWTRLVGQRDRLTTLIIVVTNKSINMSKETTFFSR